MTATPYGVAVQPEVGVAVGVPPPSPPAVAVAPVTAPEYYVWDGFEYVGWFNGAYVYWGGGVWLPCTPLILGRFHGWERYHPDWRRGAVHWRHEREPHR